MSNVKTPIRSLNGHALVDEQARAAVNSLSEEKADKFTVGDGLQMDDGVLGVYRQKME
mgnify:CR=1 FL=1